MAKLILVTHLAATWTMVGLIWFVQIVHYPLFSFVESAIFRSYHENHTRLTQWVVGPPMLIELFSAASLVFFKPALVSQLGAALGMILLAVVWASTALLQIPVHNVLGQSFSLAACRQLAVSNWVRTIGWSARGLLSAWMIWGRIR